VAAEIEAVRAFVYSVAWKMGGGWPCLKEASMAKLLSTEIAERACLDGVQVMGGYGYMMEVDMQRHLRDSILEHVAGEAPRYRRMISPENWVYRS